MKLAFLLVAGLAFSASLLAQNEAGKPIDLIILGGQSNAVGFDSAPKDLPADERDSGVMLWWKIGDPPPDEHDSASGAAWTTLKPQLLGQPMSGELAKEKGVKRQYGNFAQKEGGFGPEIPMARALLDSGSGDLAFLKVAFSGTSLADDWDSENEEKGACYLALVAELEKSIKALQEQGREVRVRGFVWIQGESDAYEKHAPHYTARLQKLVAAVREKTGAEKLPVLVCLNTKCFGGTNTFMPKIVEAQKAAAEADRRMSYVDTSEATIANKYHFDAAGTMQVGKWLADALLELEKGEIAAPAK